jgi:2-methylcitrate dehydratase PrpD
LPPVEGEVTQTADQASAPGQANPPPVTRLLAERAARIDFAMLPGDVVTRAKQCLLDWLGVTLAGSGQPLTGILRGLVLEEGGTGQATLIGAGERVTASQAALVNGAASHALDYDDVHNQMSGHPTVPVLPAVLALGELRQASGREALAAFVAGFETECRLGELVMPGHYAVGWHATATLGTFGAAAASAHLLGLPVERWQHALGIAATQAAGLKSMFGTMCKPFHAGRAASNGLLAATLAARGFTSHPQAIETAQGFAATQTTTFRPERAATWSEDDWAIRGVLFKYHAACFGTHPTIEAMLRLREAGLAPGDVESVELRVPPALLGMCNIPEPATALEGKFSLRFTAALALAEGDASERAFSDSRVAEPHLVALRDRVTVSPDPAVPGGQTEVVVRQRSGGELRERADVNVPEADLDRQWQRLEAKFRSLAEPVIGAQRAREVIERVRELDREQTLDGLLPLCVREARA